MRRINCLLSCLAAVMTYAAPHAARAQREAPRPDLSVRRLEVEGQNLIAVYVMNRGQADAPGCQVTLYVSDAAGKKVAWRKLYAFDPVARGATSKMVYDISPHAVGPGMFVRAAVDTRERVAEEDETNNTRELRVQGGEESGNAPTKPTPAPPPPGEKPPLSPDLSASDIYFKDGFVVGVVKNVGDRDFYAKDAKVADSFKRALTLRRVVRVGATSYTEHVGTRHMGDARVGQTFNAAFKRPKNVTGATEYTWVLTIEGEDPDAKNNTFTKVQQVTAID